ncbi:cardiomyopathy-associated protein 5-like [Arapaima gigas]
MDSSQQEESENDYAFTVIEEEERAGAVDEDDDIEELRKSLREIMQDQTVNPKLQCLTVDPSFSMVTVQSEDSGIVWETVSSRCSTPWASEGSTTSEAYSLEGSGVQGKVIIIMDEDKIVRKRKKRSDNKLGERLRRSSRNFSGGNERPFMTEIAVPNIRSEDMGENGVSADLKQDKEQQLFSLVSEGFEILNIMVPSRLATVDEEESTEMADNLSYLENTPQIKSKQGLEETEPVEIVSEIAEVKVDQEEKKVKEEHVVPVEPEPSQDSAAKGGMTDMDYFEKFTLLDENLPDDLPDGLEEHVLSEESQQSDSLENQEKFTSSSSAPFVCDTEMASEHLDEVFYKCGDNSELVEPAFIKHQGKDEEGSADEGGQIKSSVKESGSALFGCQEPILTPIFLSPGPPKIIDPVLLEEPAALPFLYMDLYEEAMGEKKKEEDVSDVESIVSEKCFKRRHSDSDDGDGYLEKFILKDETPVVETEPAEEDLNKGSLRMWSQSKFELTGCLTHVEEEDINEKEISTGQKPSTSVHKSIEEVTAEPENKKEDTDTWYIGFENDSPSVTGTTSDVCKNVSQPEMKINDKEDVRSHEEQQAKCEILDDIYKTTVDGMLRKELPRRDLESPSKSTPESVPEMKSQLHSASGEEMSSVKENMGVILHGNARLQEAGSVKVTEEEELVNKTQDDHKKVNITVKGWNNSGVQSIEDSGSVPRRELLRLSPLIPVQGEEESNEDQQKERQNVLDREGPYSPLRSFMGQVDLSMCGKEELLLNQAEETIEELGYEIITQQEVRDLELNKAPEDELNHECGLSFKKQHNHCPPSEELWEAEYEIIEASDGTLLSDIGQEQIDSKTQAMDTFCLVCRTPLVMWDQLYGEHQDHEVSTLDEAYEENRDKLGHWISALQERSEKIEDLVSELELAYNSVEEQFKTSEESLDKQNQEILKLVMDQYNEMSQKMEEEKKAKLEQLYDQIVEFQDRIDLAKEVLDRTVKETEESDQGQLTFLRDVNIMDCVDRLTSALESSLSLELTPSTFPMFEDYSKSPSGCKQKELEGIAIPQKPHLQAQEANSATSTSVTVYWKVNEGDVIDCFQVYCMEEHQKAISEEYRVTVKESYCTLEDLEPDKSYKVWVMAVNYTGCSLPSEKLLFRTAPATPTIDTEQSTVCWDFAIIRWSPSDHRNTESFTLEYCRQYACEGEGLRSISGIKHCEQKVLLHPNENYLFYIKAVNCAGSSEQSEATLISTRGTRFHLLKDTAHPSLELSEDMTTVHWHDGNASQTGVAGSPGILGEVLPPRGYHYWETSVRDCQAYRIGVTNHRAEYCSALGENSTSWCLHHIPTASGSRFQLLHDSVTTDIIVAKSSDSIGTLLDFIHGSLSFFDGRSGQMLSSCRFQCSEPCQAALVLEQPGSLALRAVAEAPKFAKCH